MEPERFYPETGERIEVLPRAYPSLLGSSLGGTVDPGEIQSGSQNDLRHNVYRRKSVIFNR